jgi:hypothetical protein
MTRWLYIAALLLAASSAQAQEDWERDLQPATLVGDGDPTPAVVNRPQLREHHDYATPIGASLAVGGGIALVGGWATFIGRANVRASYVVDDGVMSKWSTLGAWSFYLTAAGSAALVASEYLLLPESRDVPVLAWLGGAGGLALAAVGVGYAVGGTHCQPQALTPGSNILADCLHGTSDALFGPLLMLTSAPLLNLPITYLLRRACAGAPESLSFGPGTVQVMGRF